MQASHNRNRLVFSLIWLALSACHPQFRTQTHIAPLMGAAVDRPQPFGARHSNEEQDQIDQAQGKRIQAVNDQTFNVAASTSTVWNAAINVLMKNYNLNILDRMNGVITTEWDSFYLNGKILRNKISLRITQLPYEKSQITIINNIEAAIDASNGERKSVPWVPSEDLAGEAARVISSIASTLKIAPPKFPAKMAKYYKVPKKPAL